MPSEFRVHYQFWKFTLELTKKKRIKLGFETTKFMNKESCKILNFTQLIGTIIAACPATTYGFLFSRSLERAKTIALILNGYDYDKSMHVPHYVLQDLQWWERAVKKDYDPIKRLLV